MVFATTDGSGPGEALRPTEAAGGWESQHSSRSRARVGHLIRYFCKPEPMRSLEDSDFAAVWEGPVRG